MLPEPVLKSFAAREKFLLTAFLQKFYKNYLRENSEKTVKRFREDFEEIVENHENGEKMSREFGKKINVAISEKF